MPTRPSPVTLTNTSVDVINAIRNSASQNYRDYVPYATPDAESIRSIGAIIMDYPALQNEFLSALINRIGKVLLSSKMYSNPWEMFKKGMLEFGESIEDIFVDLAKPFRYDAAVAETEVFKREIPDVHSAFYIMNYQEFYKVTIQQEQLRQAFLSWAGITDLITKIVDSMYSAANYDEFQVMKYMIARSLYNGGLKNVTVATLNINNVKAIVTTIKSTSNYMEFMTRDYNRAGVANFASKKSQYLISSSKFDAMMDVEVLAAAFNMDKAEFMGHKVLVDSFGKLDMERLDLLFEGDPSYVHFTDEQLAELDKVDAILVDEDWFMIYDNLQNFTENYNGQGMYWNYFYHVWKTSATSPFANGCVFSSVTSSVTRVDLQPATVNATAGSTVQLSATLEKTGFSNSVVLYTVVSGPDGVTVDSRGLVTIPSTVSAGDEIVIRATASGTTTGDNCTITIVE